MGLKKTPEIRTKRRRKRACDKEKKLKKEHVGRPKRGKHNNGLEKKYPDRRGERMKVKGIREGEPSSRQVLSPTA